VVHDFESGLGRPPVDTGHFHQDVEARRHPLAKRSRDREQMLARHDDGRPIGGGPWLQIDVGHGWGQGGNDRTSVHGVYPAFTTSFDWLIFFWSWMMP
jgi:hypothetical protein